SQVRITSPCGPTAEIIAGRLFDSHVSPMVVEQSCMSLHMFGTTNDSAGSVVGRELTVGTLPRMVEVREVGAGMVLALVLGVCAFADRAPDRGQVLAVRLPRQSRRFAGAPQVRVREGRAPRRT